MLLQMLLYRETIFDIEKDGCLLNQCKFRASHNASRKVGNIMKLAGLRRSWLNSTACVFSACEDVESA